MTIGKWFIMFRIGDLAFGLGNPPQEITDQADRSRRNRGI